MTRSRALFGMLLLSSLAAPVPAEETAASFDCGTAASKVAKTVCGDASLTTLDRKAAAAYAAARDRKPSVRTPETIEGEQRGFVQQRDACERRRDVAACLQIVYTTRVSELQAVHGLVPVAGRARFACEGDGPPVIGATFFDSEAPSALLSAGDREVLVLQGPSASGARYEGDGVVFWNKGDEATVTWEEVELRCRVAK